MKKIGTLLVGVLICLLVMSSLQAVESDNGEKMRMRLNRVVRQLVQEQKILRKTRAQEKSLLDEMGILDHAVNSAEQRLESLTNDINTNQKQIPILEKRVALGHKELRQQQRRLAAHLRLMYGLGGRGLLKVAFSQENPARIRQGLLYYGRLIKNRNEEFHEFFKTIDTLNQSVEAHQNQLDTLQTLRVSLKKEQSQSKKERNGRSKLLGRIQKERGLQQRKVGELKQARDELAAFVTNLTRQLKKSVPTPQTAFKTLKGRRGKLPQPVNGYGRYKSPGLFFRTPEGSDVVTIHPGLVVYADWFRGYGLLIILNHGNRVYSLYGHNRKLLVKQGEWVGVKQSIAKTGSTGSLEGIPGLYFEIHRRGRPENPRRWLVANKRK